MTRTQQKCFIASAGLHALLLVILFVGPAFLSSSKPSDNRPLIDFVALKTIDAALSGGGSPNVRTPTPAVVQPPAPAKVETPPPAPPPQRVEKAEPVRVEKPTPPRIEKPAPTKVETPDSEAVDTKPAKKLPKVDLKPIVRAKNPTPKTPSPRVKPEDNTDSQAEAAAERRNRIASALKSAASDLRSGLSSATTIELKGPGGGGVPYANFLDAVKKVYSDAWIVPDGVLDDEATSTASITIARDGTVVNSRLVQRSGSALADQSVEMVLRRVTFAAPLPDGAKENQRTVTIKFNVKAKRGLG